MDKFVILLPLLPLLSAALTHLFSASLGRSAVKISIVSAILALIVSSGFLLLNLSNGEVLAFALSESWGHIRLDPLALVMAVVISLISLIVRVYSLRYMAEETGYERFFVLLDLMVASLILMVVANDLISLLIAWHLIGVLLYFLLGHETRSHSAYRYGFWTFITYRFGDLPMILAALLLFDAYGTWSLSDMFALMESDSAIPLIGGFSVLEVAGALIAISAFARSAQFLMHTWLPYTMEGPTPVSALMHAGIVNAGGILINRFAPLYVNTDIVLHWVFVVGLFTAVIGSVLMLAQNDIKKSLGYSTMGQMGFMIMETGVGAFALAIYHLIAHGLFKGTLFLSAGGVIGEARKHDGVPKDDLYTFIVERRSPKIQQPLLLMALITLFVPLVVLFFTHWLVAPDLFQKQGAIILLFFGWLTGAQLVFATYKFHAINVWRLMVAVLVSFVIVVIGYTVISHAFDVYLYPDPDFAKRLYEAASIEFSWFIGVIALLSLIIVLGWLQVYFAEKSQHQAQAHSKLWTYFYAWLSREFYVTEGFAYLTRRLLNLSTRLNVWLRWG